MKPSKKLLIFFTFALFFITTFYYFTKITNIFHELPQITLKDKLYAIQDEEVEDTSYIKEVKYGKIIGKPKKIDTSKLGKKKITITIENSYRKKRQYSFFIEIIKK